MRPSIFCWLLGTRICIGCPSGPVTVCKTVSSSLSDVLTADTSPLPIPFNTENTLSELNTFPTIFTDINNTLVKALASVSLYKSLISPFPIDKLSSPRARFISGVRLPKSAWSKICRPARYGASSVSICIFPVTVAGGKGHAGTGCLSVCAFLSATPFSARSGKGGKINFLAKAFNETAKSLGDWFHAAFTEKGSLFSRPEIVMLETAVLKSVVPCADTSNTPCSKRPA